jgi:hypothetical protein
MATDDHEYVSVAYPGPWAPWFAWRPVPLARGWAWLQQVNRREVAIVQGDTVTGRYPEYAAI